jgi:hypothetical protein
LRLWANAAPPAETTAAASSENTIERNDMVCLCGALAARCSGRDDGQNGSGHADPFREKAKAMPVLA